MYSVCQISLARKLSIASIVPHMRRPEQILYTESKQDRQSVSTVKQNIKSDIEQSHLRINQPTASLKAVEKPTPKIAVINSIQESNVESIETMSKYDVTLTTQTSFSRVCFFPYLLKRWSGPLSIALFLQKREVKQYKQITQLHPLDSRLQVTILKSKSNKEYPINKLRNLALDHVLTSHLWLTDMDMWPSLNLREALMAIPSEQLERTDLAVVVPAFELKGSGTGSFIDAAASADKRIPNTKSELNECIKKKRCSTFRPKERLHISTNSLNVFWYSEDYKPLLTRIRCFKGETQEPYVMVKKTPSLPHFDERFINYGYNKVQWLEHLRYFGYDFEILTNGFAVDIPHKRSQYWSNFVGQLFGKEKDGSKKAVPMKNLYHQFMKELHKNYTKHQVVGKC